MITIRYKAICFTNCFRMRTKTSSSRLIQLNRLHKSTDSTDLDPIFKTNVGTRTQIADYKYSVFQEHFNCFGIFVSIVPLSNFRVKLYIRKVSV